MGDVDGDIVDTVLESMLLEVGLLALHLLTIGGGDLGRIELEGAATLEVYETIGACIEVELQLLCTVKRVEEDHLVLVVAQMTQSVIKVRGER